MRNSFEKVRKIDLLIMIKYCKIKMLIILIDISYEDSSDVDDDEVEKIFNNAEFDQSPFSKVQFMRDFNKCTYAKTK